MLRGLDAYGLIKRLAVLQVFVLAEVEVSVLIRGNNLRHNDCPTIEL